MLADEVSGRVMNMSTQIGPESHNNSHANLINFKLSSFYPKKDN